MNNITLAAAQSGSMRGDIGRNVDLHTEMVRIAIEHGVNMIVFPELSLTGYEPEIAGDVALSVEDGRLNPLKALARQHDMIIVAGAPIKRPDDKPYLASIIIRPNTTTMYAKRFVHASEEPFFSYGDSSCVVDVHGVQVAMAICADTKHPIHTRDAAHQGAQIYAASVLFEPAVYDAHALQFQHYAMEHEMVMILANYGSPTGTWASAGQSAIWDASGKLLAQAQSAGHALVIATCCGGDWSGETVGML